MCRRNGPERLPPKQELFAELGTGPRAWDTVLASSTSGIPGQLSSPATSKGRGRCRSPIRSTRPYLVPLVELVGAPLTDPAVIARTRALMDRVGQVPVVALKETRGFVLNRLQVVLGGRGLPAGAGRGDVGRGCGCLREGPGSGCAGPSWGRLRPSTWNAPGGVADYAGRFGPLMGGITEEQTPFDYDAATVGRVAEVRRAALPLDEIEQRSGWRDRRLMALVAHKKAQKG